MPDEDVEAPNPLQALHEQNRALLDELATYNLELDATQACQVKVDLLISLLLNGPFRHIFELEMAQRFNEILTVAVAEAKKPKLLTPNG